MYMDDNDGSDMELDSDTPLEEYNDIIITHNQSSKPTNSSNTGNLLDSDKKNISTSRLPRNENSSLQSSNNENELGIKSPMNSTMTSNIYTPPQPPPFSWQLPNSIFSSPQSSPPSTPKTASSLTNVVSFKGPLIKSPMRDNVCNEPRPLEKRNKISFAIKTKSTGFKHKLLSQFNQQSVNTSVKKILPNLDKKSDTTLMDKPLSSSAKVLNSFHNELEKDNSNSKQVIDVNSKTIVGNRIVGEKESNKQSTENFSDKQIHICDGNSELIRENSIATKKNAVQQDQLVHNTTSEVYDNQQAQEVVNGVFIKKSQINSDNDENTVILKEQDQRKNEVDCDNFQIQEINLEAVQKKQVDFVHNLIEGDTADIAGKINNEIDIQNNDDNKDIVHPSSLLTVNMKSDLIELDQINIIPEQDQKNNNDENIRKNGAASYEKVESKMKCDKLETNNVQHIQEIKDNNEEIAIPANKAVMLRNEIDTLSSNNSTKTELGNQVSETSNMDHRTSFMTQFVNQINCQTESQPNTHQLINQEAHGQISNVKQSSNNQVNQSNKNIIQPVQSASNMSQYIEKIEETINPIDLSNEIIGKYHKLDNLLLEFDEVAKKAVNAYEELHRLLPEGTIIKIDPPTTYKWDIITSMFGIADVNRLEKYKVLQDNENEDQNNLNEEILDIESEESEENEENAQEEKTSSEMEFEDMDIISDDPDDKNFKCRSTIIKQPIPKRWHNTRSNKPPSANLRQRDPDSSNISPVSISLNSSSRKKKSQTTSKRTLRTRKKDDYEDSNTAISNSQSHLDSDKYYEDGKPRRPANGFSYFCGDMCAKVRNEKLPISGTISHAAEVWKKMSEEEKKPWLDRGAKSKSEYQELLNKWKEKQEDSRSHNIRKRTALQMVKSGSSKKSRNDDYK